LQLKCNGDIIKRSLELKSNGNTFKSISKFKVIVSLSNNFKTSYGTDIMMKKIMKKFE
jgi:hypothetical protein